MDELRIDSHKLMYHIDRVSEWQKGKLIPPIYMEITLSRACNHRCIFCAFDYIGYKNRFLDTKVLKKTLVSAGRLGVKSIMYGGEGEPLLHRDAADIVNYTRRQGIDVAITTNGTLLNEGIIKQCMGAFSWMRVSLNAGTNKNYKKIHGCSGRDFKKVLSNLKQAVEFKKRNNLRCVIGAQVVLIQENKKEVVKLAKLMKDIGVDYLIVKPFSKHPFSNNDIGEDFDYDRLSYIRDRLEEISGNGFSAIFRQNTMRKISRQRPYKHCMGLPFWAYIDAEGDVSACSAYLGDKKFVYGNIYKKGFSDILKGKRRKDILEMAARRLDTESCREICRLDEINNYLWELKHPLDHVNFI